MTLPQAAVLLAWLLAFASFVVDCEWERGTLPPAPYGLEAVDRSQMEAR